MIIEIIKFLLKLFLLVIIVFSVFIGLSVLSTLVFAWLLFDLNYVETLNKVGGIFNLIKISIGIGAIMIWLKSNTIQFIPFPMIEDKSNDTK